jgi:hypothetical protein
MEFLITAYIYPLERREMLSNHLGFWFDNPRTELEISVVKDYLEDAYESGYDYKFPIHSDNPIMTLEEALMKFAENLGKTDAYIVEQFKGYQRDNLFEFLAKMVIIARFDDEGIGEELRRKAMETRQEGVKRFFVLDEKHSLIKKPEMLVNYCFFAFFTYTYSGQ